MNGMTQRLLQRFDLGPRPLEPIPTPFAWKPGRPTPLRVAVAGAGTCGTSSTLRSLRASEHRITTYASAGALEFQLRGQRQPFDVIVLDCGAETDSILPALELLQDAIDVPPIVLISDDDPKVLAQARQLSVDKVLERPVQPVALLAALVDVSLLRLDEYCVEGDAF
jgi:CheY-like chemotaxis protein